MKQAIVIAALVLGIAGLATFAWRTPIPAAAPSTAPGNEPRPASITTEGAKPASKPTPPGAAPDAPAPAPGAASAAAAPTDATSIDAIDALDRAARAGDGRAACRMAAAISRCQQVRLLQRFQQDERSQIDALARDPSDAADVERQIDELVRRERLLDEAAAGCAGYEQGDRLTVARYHVVAANAGHVPSMLATIHPMQMSATALIRDPALIDDYRANAGARFRRILEAGDLRLLGAWLAATSFPDPSPLLDQLPPEWRDPALVAAIVAQLSEEQQRGLPGLDAFGRAPPITDAARTAGEALYRRYFADSPSPPMRVLPGSDSLGMLRGMLSRDDLGCDEAPTR